MFFLLLKNNHSFNTLVKGNVTLHTRAHTHTRKWLISLDSLIACIACLFSSQVPQEDVWIREAPEKVVWWEKSNLSYSQFLELSFPEEISIKAPVVVKHLHFHPQVFTGKKKELTLFFLIWTSPGGRWVYFLEGRGYCKRPPLKGSFRFQSLTLLIHSPH